MASGKSLKVGIGVIGTGNMSLSHLKDIGKIENAKLIAVCDI